ncbi:hypothetical protein KUTeg_017424 [Tegillarca granosa]|uniref:Centlein n=1 Tax=Tegillarca granosa TaxID=220873 RepID=A0ABQ9EHE5_TEGGR|nr:hypothetical protein KUTeg_017424 [Tegillarca granosa]
MTTLYMGPGDNMSKLEYDNTTLVEELRQCQADKDFVWTLWKKLQVANPNVTQAISLVVQREKEKAEIKDRKVLEILQMKDEKIEELQNLLSSRTRELGDLAIRRVDTTEDFSRLHIELDRLRDKNTSLESQLKSFQNREKSLDDLHKSTVINAEQDRNDQQKIIEKLKMELEMVKSEKAENISQRLTLENKARILERDVTDKMKKFESMIEEFEEAKRLLQQYQERTEKMHREIDYKNQELENVRKELSELWNSHNQLSEHSSQQADLIRQLQSLQQDTQKMLKNTEDAYSNEAYSLQTLYTELTSRYEMLQKTETDLRRQVNSLRSEILDKNNTISTLQSKVDSHRRKRKSDMGMLNGSFISNEKEDVEPVIDLEFKVKSLQREINLLRDTLHEKDSIIEQLEKRKDPLDLEFDVSRLNRRERSHSTPARELRSVALSPMTATRHTRTSSVSPVRSNKDTKYQLVMSERKVEDLKNTLKLRNRELEELKRAHAKRLERLKSSLNNYKLIKEQLKTLEDENSSKKKKKLRRSDPKKLQREDSDAVWNELAYFKNENRNLVVERMSLEEEIDSLKVKTSQDAATIHELTVALQQEQEDREFEKRKTEMKTQATSDIQSELTLLKSEVQNKNFKLERMEKDLREATADRANLQEEKRILKAEVFELKQEAAQHRIEKANYNRDINRLQRDLEEERSNKLQQHIVDSDKDLSPSPKPGHRSTKHYPNKPALRIRRKDNKTRSQAAKKYQRALNKSIEKMRNVFNNFDEDGWEEISSIEEEETEETESDTLGQTIKMKIRQQNRNAARQRSVINLPQSRSTTSQKLSTNSPHASRQHFSNMNIGFYKKCYSVTTLRESRAKALKALADQKEACRQVESDLNLANQRLRMSKQNIQASSNEICRQSAALRQQKQDNDSLQEQVKNQQDRKN